MENPPRPNLEYDRTSTVVTVRGFRALLMLTLLNTLVLGWFVVGPQMTPFVRGQWQQWQAKREMRRQETQFLALQQQCLTHTIPAGTVAYTEEPALAATLARERKRYVTVRLDSARLADWVEPVALKEPPFWTAMRGLGAANGYGYEMTNPYPMVFLHERTAPRGQRRVVVVQWVAEQTFSHNSLGDGNGGMATSRLLAARLHAPASRGVQATLIDHVQVRVKLPPPDVVSLTGLGQGGPIGIKRPPPLTLFAGEADPVDLSHFTIPYAVGQDTGVIDGWVTEDELVLKPRLGKTTVVQGQQTWVLGAAAPGGASTRPATAPAQGR